ncbi:hypothetical protein [Pseudoalteromonas sp. GABNS16H]|uniref:hypothetical protein n=1 Tax=Pseudoalteromonas sp. GABNS16H TaxID=3025325 RepID=UPI00235F3E0A|nr:hypothetical protein [Pseudoalteromonas sp. GABNS16H]MDC9611845.1 hypothetical protein [Pseudoalteromonas sp. GABNS16H]
MNTGPAIYKPEKPHPVLLAGMVSGFFGAVMESFILLAVFVICMAWWLPNKLKPSLLRKHEDNTEGETINLGKIEIPLAECSMGATKFHYFLRGLPQVAQLVTARDPETGTVSQYLLITRLNGHTHLHPIIEN